MARCALTGVSHRWLIIAAIVALVMATGAWPAEGQQGWFLLLPPRDEGFFEMLRLRSDYESDPSDKNRNAVAAGPQAQFDKYMSYATKKASTASPKERAQLLARFGIAFDAPVNLWRQFRAYDSAAACERDRAQGMAALRRQILILGEDEKAIANNLETNLEVFFKAAALEASRCVPASR